jgi:type II secretory pathway pseudopilin PulG
MAFYQTQGLNLRLFPANQACKSSFIAAFLVRYGFSIATLTILSLMITQPTLPSTPHSGPHANLAQAGFSYIALLITLALIGVATAATMQMGVLLQQRVAEEELMAIGIEFHRALISYAGTAQPGQARAPRTMEDLLKDPRAPNIRRHLRKIYIDPMTGKDEWGIIPSPDGRGIVGIFSLSQQKPIKIANFQPPFQHFGDLAVTNTNATYADWKFMGLINNNRPDPTRPENRPPGSNQSQNRNDPTRPENRPLDPGQNQVPGVLEVK